MNNRIQQFIDAERITPAKLADALGVQRSNISHILGGRNKPGFDFIEKMLRVFPQVSPDWLLLGKGSMYREVFSPSLFPEDEDNYRKKDKEEPFKTVFVENDKPKEAEKDVFVSPTPMSAKIVERVMVFYTDNTFDTYIPSTNK